MACLRFRQSEKIILSALILIFSASAVADDELFYMFRDLQIEVSEIGIELVQLEIKQLESDSKVDTLESELEIAKKKIKQMQIEISRLNGVEN